MLCSRLLLAAFFCSTYFYGYSTITYRELPIYFGALTKQDRPLVEKLYKLTHPYKTENDAAIVEMIDDLKNDFYLGDRNDPLASIGHYSLSYMFVDHAVGYSTPINRALRDLATSLMVAGNLNDALAIARCYKHNSTNEHYKDGLWPFFLPAAISQCTQDATPKEALSVALKYLHTWVDDIITYPFIESTYNVDHIGTLGACWALAVENIITTNQNRPDIKAMPEHLEPKHLEEILEQIEILVDYTDSPLKKLCFRSFGAFRKAVQKEIKDLRKLSRQQKSVRKDHEFIELCIQNRAYVGNAKERLYRSCKHDLLQTIHIALTAATACLIAATSHEQFSNAALEKTFTKYQTVQQKFNNQSAGVTRVIGNIRISGCGYREYCDLAKHYEAMAPIFQKKLDEIIEARGLTIGKQTA